MKKVFLLTFCTMLAFILASCNNEGKFDENLQKAYKEAILTHRMSGMIAGNTVKVWNTAIFDHKGVDGSYVSDFNDALSDLFSKYKSTGIIDSLQLHKNRLDSLAGEMADPPSSRKDVYNDFVGLVTEIDALERLAEDPTGSLQDYSSTVMEHSSNVQKKNDEFKIKYAKYLKEEK